MTGTSRRQFIGTTLALGITPLACSSPLSAPARSMGRRAGPGMLQPGVAWKGTPGSGGRAPAQSDTPLGTLVPDECFTGGFSAIPGQWVHGEGVKITALGLPPQPWDSDQINYFKEAVFFLEGESVTVREWSVNDTPVRMHDGRMAPQGSVGFSVEIGAGLGRVTAGDAILYCYLRGEHGLERRIELPLVINVDRSLDADRHVVHVHPALGNDAASGTAEQPWRTLTRALSLDGVRSGGKVILLGSGNYVEDVGPRHVPTLQNGRMIEVEPKRGLVPEQVVITMTSRLGISRWKIYAQKVHFQGLTVDLGKIVVIQSNAQDSTLAFSGCRLVDPAGAAGPRDSNGIDLGYYTGSVAALREAIAAAFVPAARIYLSECLFINYSTQGARLYRNVTAESATDSFSGGPPGYDDVVVDGYFVTMPRDFRARLHPSADLVVASTRTGPDGNTIVQITGSPGLPLSKGGPDFAIAVTGGALTGQDRIGVVGTDANSLMLNTKLALSPGDRVRYFYFDHVDFCQQKNVFKPEQSGLRNTTIFRYHGISPSAQLFLTQGYAALEAGTTITTIGKRFSLKSGSGRPNVVLPSDVLKLDDGPRGGGEYRLVEGYDPATATGTLLEPFSKDQADSKVGRGKTVNGFVMALSNLRKTGVPPIFKQMGQLQDGHRNFVVAHSTFISQPYCVTFNNNRPGHGNRNHVHLFNVYFRMDGSYGLPFPSYGLRIEGCQFLEGEPRGKDARKGGELPPPADAARYVPPKNWKPVGRRPLIPFDAFGRALTEASPLGAISV